MVKYILKREFLQKRFRSFEVRLSVKIEFIPLPNAHRVIVIGHGAREIPGFDCLMMGYGQIFQKLKNSSGTLVWAAGSDPSLGDGQTAPQI